MINILTDYEKGKILQIPEDITKSEIIKFYTLSNADTIIISHRYKDEVSRLGVAIQLCVLRHKGWPFSYIKVIPKIIIEHISEQLKISPATFDLYYVHKTKKAISKHFNAIVEIYNFTKFDDCLETNKTIFKILEESDNSYFLVYKYVEFLKNSKVILPAIYKIEEIVSKAKTEFENQIINSIFTQIDKGQQSSIDKLLDINNETRKTTLAWLREENGSSSVKQFINTTKKLDLLERIHLNVKTDMVGVATHSDQPKQLA